MDEHGFDQESATLVRMLARGQWLPHEVTGIQRAIFDRRAYVDAGLSNPTARYWTAKLRAEVEGRLRMRWDFRNGWTIDRWVTEEEPRDCWWTIGVLGFNHIPINLCDYLKQRDMQRVGARKYLEQKRAEAEQVRAANDKKSTERVLGAVDQLSEKRMKEFIAVERAIQTGETITVHGQMEKMMDHMTQASQAAGQTPEPEVMLSENEAYNPHKLTRKSGGQHI